MRGIPAQNHVCLSSSQEEEWRSPGSWEEEWRSCSWWRTGTGGGASRRILQEPGDRQRLRSLEIAGDSAVAGPSFQDFRLKQCALQIQLLRVLPNTAKARWQIKAAPSPPPRMTREMGQK
jgi:hypothetical protein